ncbi:alpha-glucuronidase [Silvibacterium bohemicum]|uniref:Xylan alpha-1,2-glucuronidase n=1 Tax=Silvibacterium bohemicum TaxID=1577686 RepID=A0A841K570_9BACT|nr:alpha-glucuronidase family glycosyl hydrolase [Silvibacterium bohemicum]MBB6145424.1 alpha-glucuronidase [Silvibacterium bohemicum]
MLMFSLRGVAFGALVLASTSLLAEDGSAGWLRYARLEQSAIAALSKDLPAEVETLDTSPVVLSARSEAQKGISSMLGRTLQAAEVADANGALVLGTVAEVQQRFPSWKPGAAPQAEGYILRTIKSHGHSYILVAGADPNGVLYGTFRLLEKIAEGQDLARLNDVESPAAPIRWVDQWDNSNGTIERGYSGRSIFFDNGTVRPDLARAGEYARLLASVGINGADVNNVNADLKMLSPEMIKQVARIADQFRPWGVRLALSVDVSSPKVVGGLDTFDPLDPKVIAWWQKAVDDVYAAIPDFAGFTVKADSEGRAGPAQYGRTPMDAANVLARALKPHGGVLLYRAFVYNHHADWKDPKADRARAAYNIFHSLDGKFDDNVIVQIKNGPIDFQVREPASPLFAGLPKTNVSIEVQATQEYTGQQRHLVFLIPMWKQVLDLDMRAENRSTPVKEIVEGKSFHRPLGGFVAVANVGLDTNWLHHPLAMANLYGFGRLAWNPDTSSETIARDWTRLTFGNNAKVVDTVSAMLLSSWPLYEDYTGPLGLGTLTNILGPHYGPGIESAERNGWGQWLRADHDGIGMDRTVATGTGYIGQYPPELAAVYESLKTCPDELLLFMHHVAYTYKLHDASPYNGETVVQWVYDSHYKGAAGAAKLVEQWKSLDGLVDQERYAQVLALQEYQAGHAIVWRDAVNSWFHKMSGVDDAQGRVDHFPNRIEAEAMTLDGYTPVDVTPWETASGGKAVVCKEGATCSATAELQRPAGLYDIAVQYFDLHDGVSTYKLYLGSKLIGEWKADNTLIFNALGGDTSTRYTIRDVMLHPGDTLKLVGQPDRDEPAPVDYIEIDPAQSKVAAAQR